MAYSANHDGPGNLAYIFGDLWLELNRHHSIQQIDNDALKMDCLVACWADHDTDLAQEWSGILSDRREREGKGYVPGQEGFEHVDLAFRFREIKALTRSAYRNGIIAKLPVASVKWNPEIAPEA